MDSIKGKSVVDLNSDCIMHLFMFLPLTDRLRLAFVNNLFDEAIRHFIQFDNISMDELIENFSTQQVEELFQRFGTHIKKINCFLQNQENVNLPSESIRKYFKSISNHCHCIEEIVIRYPWIPDYSIYERIFQSARRISKVNVAYGERLQGKFFSPNEFDSQLSRLFQDLPLKSLDVSHQCDLIGKFLPKLKHLTEVNLEYCALLEPKHLTDFLNVAKLKSLNIVNCPKLTGSTFETLYRTQTELQSIAISNNYSRCHLEVVGRLEALRHIRFDDHSDEMLKLRELLNELVQHHANDLETLEIYNDFTYRQQSAIILQTISELKNLRKLVLPDIDPDSDDGIKRIIKKCHQLEELSIVSENGLWAKDETLLLIIAAKHLSHLRIISKFQIKTTLLKDFYQILKAKNLPLDMYVDERNIDVSVLNTPEYKEHEKLLRIHVNEVNIDDILTNSYLF
ncbi:uncharacterized protein LOC119650192 [Hermetia illucens]|uniref:uncharacterized protein LOC119650192 n=1 Tax=Hermetia illucens TaxID=343691 RepID=UPI0018CBFA89|nr:uncharacterized protein LOC119650192 [Hermetia illucens]XP_037908685.1 uncharacterized protein LOC119650192 [Hermetia illucens]XP_037908686.1 uncharacterized protein LOC119650192 [Hermetia illucens]